MQIKKINGELIKINLNNVKNIFDLKCKLADLDKLDFFDIKILHNGKEIDNNYIIWKFDKFFYIPVMSKMGYKVRHIFI